MITHARVLMVAAAALALMPACKAEVQASANTPAGKVGVQGNAGVPPPGGVPDQGAPSVALGDGSLIRLREGTAVYVLAGGLRRHIPDRQTFDALGLQWGAIVNVPKAQLDRIQEGPALATDKAIAAYVPDSMSKMGDRTLVRADKSELTFLILLGQRHLIRDAALITALHLNPASVITIPREQMALIPQGPQW